MGAWSRSSGGVNDGCLPYPPWEVLADSRSLPAVPRVRLCCSLSFGSAGQRRTGESQTAAILLQKIWAIRAQAGARVGQVVDDESPPFHACCMPRTVVGLELVGNCL